MKEIERIVVHGSASTWGDDPTIDGWHKARGWNGNGYNAMIYNGYPKGTKNYYPEQNGLLVQGRAVDLDTFLSKKERGAHAYGFNSSSLGICLIGKGTKKEDYSPQMFYTLACYYFFWRCIIPGIELIGHNEISKKPCPGFSVIDFKKKCDRLISIDPCLHGIEKF